MDKGGSLGSSVRVQFSGGAAGVRAGSRQPHAVARQTETARREVTRQRGTEEGKLWAEWISREFRVAEGKFSLHLAHESLGGSTVGRTGWRRLGGAGGGRKPMEAEVGSPCLPERGRGGVGAEGVAQHGLTWLCAAAAGSILKGHQRCGASRL